LVQSLKQQSSLVLQPFPASPQPSHWPPAQATPSQQSASLLHEVPAQVGWQTSKRQ